MPSSAASSWSSPSSRWRSACRRIAPDRRPPATPLPTIEPVVPYREGTLGRPVSVNPLAARTQVDRDLVALTFSGLVKLGPDGILIPDLAARWTTDETGKSWTFSLRPDARWHDGEPVTAHDVVFTINVLRDPTYTGPGAGSWREVTPTAVDERTVQFDLTTPLGGFLQLATQPIAPAHLLDRRAGRGARRRPVRPGADRLGAVRDGRARRRPCGPGAGRIGRPGGSRRGRAEPVRAAADRRARDARRRRSARRSRRRGCRGSSSATSTMSRP